jgi:Rieske Fe-S protein
MLDNGTLRFEGLGGAISGGGVVGSGTGNFPITATVNANRGLTIANGGGTIDVQSPFLTVALTGANGQLLRDRHADQNRTRHPRPQRAEHRRVAGHHRTLEAEC